MSNNHNKIIYCKSEKISNYSSNNIVKGLDLAKRILNANTPRLIETKSDISQPKQFLSRYIWKCVDTILHYSAETVEHISISPDGKIFAIKSRLNNEAIDIWDIENSKLIKTIICSFPKTFEISNNSKQIIICEQNDLIIKNIYSTEIICQINLLISDDERNSCLLTDFDSSIAISSGLNLIVAHYENKIYIWDIVTGDLLRQFTSQHNSSFDKTLFIANESPILVVYDSYSSSKPEVWNPISGKLLYHCDFEFYPNLGTAITSDGSILFSANEIFDIKTSFSVNDLGEDANLHLAYLHGDDNDFSSASSFSKDGKTLVIGGYGGAIKVLKQLSINEILRMEPNNQQMIDRLVDKLNTFADEQYDSGNFTEAIDSYTTAIEIDSNNFQAYNGRSTVRAATGDYQGAMEDLQKARMMN
jgi:WD40 repeat protein